MAKEQKPAEPVAANLTETEQPKSILGSRLIVILALFVLALAQMIVFYMLLPNPQTIAQGITDTLPILPDDVQTAGFSPTPTVRIETRDWIEKKLGDPFKYMNKNKTDPTLSDNFIGTITVRIDKKDEQKFDRVMATRTEKLRDIVYTVLREAKEEEFVSPNLLQIKQKIMMKINEELGQPFVKEVLCTDMSFQTS
ncbi:MAG: flagellar basal body-associated FliL family protein [Planctomycetaceae bacterium]|jgi:flagellar basal body-associated protein FliL|nr:flagellar basal body-associated FliL family protein [Planctomycetaceae bacterium]